MGQSLMLALIYSNYVRNIFFFVARILNSSHFLAVKLLVYICVLLQNAYFHITLRIFTPSRQSWL